MVAGRQADRVRAQCGNDGKPTVSQIYLLSMEGGEARPLTDMPKGPGAPVWSPDGKTIAFTSTAKPEDFEKKKDKDKEDEKSDVRVITKAAYRFNGSGYMEPGRPSHIWTVEVPRIPAAAEKAKQVTSGDFSESDIVWSKDGSKLYFLSDRVAEPYYQPPANDLYMVAARGGEISKVTSIEGPIHAIALSPEGGHMAFIGSINRGEKVVQRSYSQPDLFVTSLESGASPRNLTAKYDFDIGGGVGGDQAPPRGGGGSRPYWSKDGRFVFVVSSEEGSANLKRIDAETGQVEALTQGKHDVFAYSATPTPRR